MKPTRFFLWLMPAIAAISSAIGQPSARQIADINPGPEGSFPSNMTALASSVYFSAYTPATGRELWRSDGTNAVIAADINNTTRDAGGGVLVGNDSIPEWLTVFSGALYFSAFDPRRGDELWRYDSGGAIRVSDINPDANDTVKSNPNNAWPSELTVFQDALYFRADSGTATHPNYELWKYDPVSGAKQAANIHPDSGTDYSSYPTGLFPFNGALYFMADDGSHGYELWKYDGTNAALMDLNPGTEASSSFPKNFTVFNNRLYFQAYTDADGFELWQTDGTTAAMVADLNPGNASSFPDNLIVFGDALYFRATDPTYGSELWKYDGVQAQLAADINPAGDSSPKNLTQFRNALYFAADDGVHGWELWKYDGASASLVSDLNPSGDSFPESLTVVGEDLYFVASTPDTGYELWRFDGTQITLVADINPGGGDSFPAFLSNAGGRLYFSAADDGTSNWELWTIDSANLPPSVTLTSPQAGQTIAAPATVALHADATDPDGKVSQVEFFNGSSSVGALTTGPFDLNLPDLPAGIYIFTAVATDDSGNRTTSSQWQVNVAQQPRITSVSQSGDSIVLSVSVTKGIHETLEGSTDFKSWTMVSESTPDGNTATFTDSAGASNRFYRVVAQ